MAIISNPKIFGKVGSDTVFNSRSASPTTPQGTLKATPQQQGKVKQFFKNIFSKISDSLSKKEEEPLGRTADIFGGQVPLSDVFNGKVPLRSDSQRMGNFGMKVNTQNSMTQNVAFVIGKGATVLDQAAETVLPVVQIAAQGLAAGVGVTSIFMGIRDLGKAHSCYQRSEGLKKAPAELEQLKSDVTVPLSEKDKSNIDILMLDLKFCQESNRTRAKDMALSGFFDATVGTGLLVAAFCTTGASAAVATGIWAGSQVVKVAVRTYRGAQMTKSEDQNRQDVQERLSKGMFEIQEKFKKTEDGNLTLDKNGLPELKESFSATDKAFMIALKSVNLIPKDTNVNEFLSAATLKTLSQISTEDVVNKFTAETVNIRTKEGDSMAKNAFNIFKNLVT